MTIFDDLQNAKPRTLPELIDAARENAPDREQAMHVLAQVPMPRLRAALYYSDARAQRVVIAALALQLESHHAGP